MNLDEPLTGRRIIVRSYTRSDLEFCTKLWFDPENGRYLSDPDREHVDEVFRRALERMQDSENGYYFIVELRDSGERIGTCCAFPEDDGAYDIGYCIEKSRWRQGFGTELVEVIVNWVRKQGGSAITAEAARANEASCGLLEKCGFTVLRESCFNKYHMDVQFESVIYKKDL